MDGGNNLHMCVRMSIAKLQTEATAQEMDVKAVYVNLWNKALDGKITVIYFSH